jgi:ribosome-associated heat shock protein Hsp15
MPHRDDASMQRSCAPVVATQRLDHWLWCARFYKTRSLATAEIDRGRVEVNNNGVKPAKSLTPGDEVSIARPGASPRLVVRVLGLARTRGPASVAQALYEETPASLAARRAADEARRLAPEPAAAIRDGRPTKRDRRQIGQATQRWTRWSASIDDDDNSSP